MGIIQQQAVKGTVINYLGVLVGFVTVGLLQPLILSTTEIGLINLLNRYALIFAQVFSLGFPALSLRIFPALRDVQKQHNGYIYLGLIYLILGFLTALAVYFLTYEWLLLSGKEKSKLFEDFIFLLPYLIFFNLIYIISDTYIRMRYNAIIGAVTKEIIQRIAILTALLIFYFGLVGRDHFVILYTMALAIPGVIMLFYSVRTPEFSIRPNHSFLRKFSRRSILNISLFGLLSSTTTILVIQVDTLMVNYFEGLSSLGIYTTMFYFGILVSIPSRALKRISGTMISDAWSKKDLTTISKVYFESCLNQSIIGGLLFLGVWLNVDSMIQIIGTEFTPGKWVVFFIGLGYLFDMLTGENASIITTSHLYRYNTYFAILLLVLLFVSNLIFLPSYGIIGAAFSSAGSMFVVNLLRFILLKTKLNLQPFNYKFLIVGALFAITYLTVSNLPACDEPTLDLLVRGSLTTALFAGGILALKVSPSLNRLFTQLLQRVL
ncbi:MATE family efflux transporter [Halocola ammonii]